MGMSDQVGNEIDEFVTNTLRNNLLGLPLDLPAINMTRARSEGIPSLNNVRKQIFAATNDGQLAPYENWVAFGQALKHPESLVNFIAAYGTHPSITSETTLAGKRAAAKLIVSPDLGDVPPSDAGDFLFSEGAFANSGSTSLTGLDAIDLWVGGLAENTLVFGGLLGSTFNYVFENQLTNLQNGDRFYYLGRTPGMNLRAQLEGNSFSELVMRNTDAYALKADPFATADCKFHLGDLQSGTADVGSFLTGPGTVNDVLSSECDENRLLLRQPNGRIEYRAINSVDPSGINGQAVYDGTAGVDRIFGGNDNDTFWGREGNDIIDGRGGDDVVLGGEGNDIITDLGGFDVLKGGPGNDAIDGGVFDDIIMGGDGDDFTNGGANNDEHFMGAGDDFTIGGQGFSAVFGDSGNDWMEGGDMADLLIGDSSTLFFDDHNVPGHDVTIGQGGDDDYDTEGGDDVMVGGPGVEKNAGASGYDWLIGVGDPQPQFADLNLKILPEGQPAIEVRDRFNEVEALSGWKFNDQLFGDDAVPAATGGGGFIGCDVLSQAGLDRITGLDPLIPDLNTLADTILANTTTRYCLIEPGELVWGDGNVLLGGAGSDTLEGRGADDILDGDRYMNVRIGIHANADGTGPEIATTQLMENVPTGTDWSGPLAGKTLQQAVFAGLIDPGQLEIVREILTPTALELTGNIDTAFFSAPLAGYTIDLNPDGSVTISDAAGAAVDGTDILWNVEQASFCNGVDAAGRCNDSTVVPLPTLTGGPGPLPVAAVATTPLVQSLAFGSVNTGVTTAAQTVTVTNTGTASLIVSGVTTTDPQFAVATNLCTTVPVAGSCTITVSFAPTATGPVAASLRIATNAVGSPSSVALSGTGLAPVATASPATLAFGSANTGTTTVSQAVTIGNSGNAPLTVSSIALTGTDPGSFTLTPTTCAPIPAGGTCTVNVAFRPTSSGAKSAAVTVTHNSDNLAGSTSSVALTGTGLAPTAAVTPATLAFGSVTTGTVSTGQTITVSNTGNAPLTVTSIAVTGTNAANFTATPTGCATVAAGGSCIISVTFAPATAGAKTATVGITHNSNNAPGTVSNVALNGTGVAPTSPRVAMPATLAFGAQRINANKTVTLTVTNQGPGALVITSVTTSGAPFTATRGNCPASLAAGRNCKLDITYRPTVRGLTSTGTVTVISNASNSPTATTLTGTGR